jgi:hypothetical protein
MRSWIVTLGGVCALFVGLFAAGCDDAEEAFDCQQVCSRYQDCYDANYDVGACRARCRTASDNNPSIRNDANQCEACMDDMSCASTIFNCAAPCSSIVP